MSCPLLLPTAKVRVIRQAIYDRLGVSHYSASYRSRKLRKVCAFACGLDLRRREHCVILAQHLGVMVKPDLPEVDVPSYEDLFAEATAKGHDREQQPQASQNAQRLAGWLKRKAN